MNEQLFTILATLVLVPMLLATLRLVFVLPSCRKFAPGPKSISTTPKSVLILLGSGGHTGEMIRVLKQFEHFGLLKRTYAISDSDKTSLASLQAIEKSPSTIILPRARNVGENKVSAIIRSLKSFIATFRTFATLKTYPDVFLCNGPGTAIPIAYVLFFFKFLGLCHTKIIYVESLARVKQLSLTGWLILPISDRILVQWESLAKKYKRCEYHGILV
ncbi:hypothetical protein OGAPHI_005679 [Ogataea philodendri]|uniref:UDP-N-acetylglucosamine transferase subunit ALG14 n=1 Tax=Ogataea philodendri TaxID=1378263 RepID=A0A9P8P067_9ASCO|nr:uncharacterized protein OGAPHI_005679 [Ogataea philodendri]KAH3662427.1 hypothetical protein OGAPHI_005679 [Ogataea philodendri]